MPEWIVYYDDGSNFSSQDGLPHQAPRDGVQCIAVKDIGCGKLIWHSADWYCWQGEWVPHNEGGLRAYLRDPGLEKIVLQGYGIAYRRFQSIYMAAVNDQRLPFKTADDPRELPRPT